MDKKELIKRNLALVDALGCSDNDCVYDAGLNIIWDIYDSDAIYGGKVISHSISKEAARKAFAKADCSEDFLERIIGVADVSITKVDDKNFEECYKRFADGTDSFFKGSYTREPEELIFNILKLIFE